MELKFDRAKWEKNADGTWLAVRVKNESINAALELADKVADKDYTADIKRDTGKRSLDANRYFWVLCGRLAEKMKTTKESLYREFVRDVPDNNVIVPIKREAAGTWMRNWERNGIGWICDDLQSSKLDGYTNIINYYGSSTYDKRQMSRLIDLLVDECHIQGVDTKSPEEIASLCEGWGSEKADKSA